MSDDPFVFDFLSRSPEGRLGRFVRSIWFARGTVPYAREKIAPTGSTVGVFVLGDPIVQTPNNGAGDPFTAERGFLVGPHDRPAINEPVGETFAVGIVTTSVGCRAVFGVAPSEPRGRVVDLETAWPVAAVLRSRLLATAEGEPMLDLVETTVADSLGEPTPGLARCERAVSLVEADPTRAISDIARELGVSHGHLDREFKAVVGLTPRVLSRLLRMRRLLSQIDVGGEVGWAELASALGWFDQAHLIRDFKRHTGVTPSQYVSAQRDTYRPEQRDDATGFVPES